MVEVLVENKNIFLFAVQRSGTTAFIQNTVKLNNNLVDYSYALQYRKGRKVVLDNSGLPFPIQSGNTKIRFPPDNEYKNIFNTIEHFNKQNIFYICKVLLNHNNVNNILNNSSVIKNSKKIILWRHPFDIILSMLAVKSPNGCWYGANEYTDYDELSINVAEFEKMFKRYIDVSNNLVELYQSNPDDFTLYNYDNLTFEFADTVKQRTPEYNEAVYKNTNILENYRKHIKLPF